MPRRLIARCGGCTRPPPRARARSASPGSGQVGRGSRVGAMRPTCIRARAPDWSQDEADLFGPVEMDDGDKDHAEHGAGVEGRRPPRPSWAAGRPRRRRARARGPQAAGDLAGLLVDLADRAGMGVGGRPDADAAVGIGQEAVGRNSPRVRSSQAPCGAPACRQVAPPIGWSCQVGHGGG